MYITCMVLQVHSFIILIPIGSEIDGSTLRFARLLAVTLTRRMGELEGRSGTFLRREKFFLPEECIAVQCSLHNK